MPLVTRVLVWSASLCLCVSSARSVQAQALPGDPLAYDLRIGLFPVAFQAGVTQSHFGPALRAEYRVLRRLELGVYGRAGVLNVGGEARMHGYTFGLGASIHVHESLEQELLVGTVYPDNPPALSGPGSRGAASDLDVPVSTRLGSTPFVSDVDRTAVALIYSVVSLRVGALYTRVAMPAELATVVGASDASDASEQNVASRFPLLSLGLGWGSHWNIPPDVTGKHELGYRRFYVDAVGTLPSSVRDANLFAGAGARHPEIFPFGARLGMEGSIDALLSDAPGVGFAYSLELGALPARNALEGYLFVGFGLALDFATR
jgi:hypothetical protein